MAKAAARGTGREEGVEAVWERQERREKARQAAKQEHAAIRAISHSGWNREMSTTEVDNPEYSRNHDGAKANPKKINSSVNLRESAITALAARGQLDAAQVAAAERFRQLWEAMGGKGAGSIDYLKEPVDGGGPREPLSPSQFDAGKELDAIRTKLGEFNYRLVCRICGEGYSIHELTKTRRQRDTMADVLRLQLDILAERWHYSTAAQRSKDVPLYLCGS